jgi:autotransporter-associated beta strand protein
VVGTGETTDRVINLAGTTGGGTIDQSGTGLLQLTSAFTATGAGVKTLTLQGSTGGTGEIAGAIVDNSSTNKTSVTKAGTGTWTLSGSNTYTGATIVNAGTLLVNGSLAAGSAVAVNGGATLGGTGTVNGLVTVAGGATSAAQGSIDLRDNAIGTLALNGGLTLGGGTAGNLSNLFFDLGTTVGANDVISITGTPTINTGGGTLAFAALGSLTPGDYTLITATTGSALGTSAFTLASSTITAGATTYDLSLSKSTGTAEILSVISIPEPATISLAAMMGLGLLGMRRRRA